MTYNVFGGTLNLTLSIYASVAAIFMGKFQNSSV